jgi:SAM-dependent methyltransferase
MTLQPSFEWLFDRVAPDYEDKIIPAFGQLAENFVGWIGPRPTDFVVDVGTGTGIVPRYIAPRVAMVIGIDFIWRMAHIATSVAREQQLPNAYFVQSDAHRLAFADSSFNLITASFGLNTTIPRKVFPELHRILKANGRLCIQEWGGWHAFDQIMLDVIDAYAVYDEDAPPELIALRDFTEVERPWYRDMQTEEDYEELLAETGFVQIEADEHQPVIVRLTVNEFLSYKLAWVGRSMELDAMDESARGDCIDQLRDRFYDHVDGDGMLNYDPKLFRIQARRSD